MWKETREELRPGTRDPAARKKGVWARWWDTVLTQCFMGFLCCTGSILQTEGSLGLGIKELYFS